MRINSGRAGMVLVAGLLAAGPAAAQDVEGALQRMQELLGEQGVSLDWENAEIEDDDATLTGVTATSEGEAAPIGDIEITDVAETENAFTIGEIAMPSYTAEEAGATLTVENLVLSDVSLPRETAEPQASELFLYERASLERLVVERDGAELFTLDNMTVEVSPPEDGAPLVFSGGAESFTADLAATDDEKAREVLTRLGYETVSGTMSVEGSWAPDSGRLTLGSLDFVVEDAGTLTLGFTINGYTPEFAEALRQISDEMASGSDQSSQGLAILGLMQQLELEGLEISFEDNSLTERVLAYAAEDQGTTPEAVADQTKAVLPFLMAQADAPELTQMVSEAASEFLDDPQSLTIEAAPAEPVPFATLLATGMTSLDALAERIGLTVTANE